MPCVSSEGGPLLRTRITTCFCSVSPALESGPKILHTRASCLWASVLLLAGDVQTQILKSAQQTANPMGGNFLNSENKLDWRLHIAGQQ